MFAGSLAARGGGGARASAVLGERSELRCAVPFRHGRRPKCWFLSTCDLSTGWGRFRMVRDPSIVSPSLTGVFIGGGHNKHGTGSRCTLLNGYPGMFVRPSLTEIPACVWCVVGGVERRAVLPSLPASCFLSYDKGVDWRTLAHTSLIGTQKKS